MPIPTVQDAFGVAAPVFIRKLTRKSHWGDAGDNAHERLANAVAQLFPESDGVFSFYRVANDLDLRRVALAMNGNRSSPDEALALLAFLPNELEQCGLLPEQFNEGGTKCIHANELHFNIAASAGQLSQLCALAMRADRKVGSLSKGTMKLVVAEGQKDGCPVVVPTEAAACRCEIRG